MHSEPPLCWKISMIGSRSSRFSGVRAARFQRSVQSPVRRHPAVREIAVVRDRQVVATGPRRPVAADLVEPLPEQAVRGRVDVGDRQFRHVRAPEDDVAVVVRDPRRAGVLVAHEAGEATSLRAVVGVLGRFDDLLPGAHRPFAAERPVLAAELLGPARCLGGDDGAEHLHPHALVRAERRAELRAVARRLRIPAQAAFTQELAVVRDGHEVERPVDRDAALGRAVLADGPERDGLAPGEAVGVRRRRAGAVRRRVEREAGVDVQVTEQRLAERRGVEAGGPVFRARDGRASDTPVRCSVRARRRAGGNGEHEQR